MLSYRHVMPSFMSSLPRTNSQRWTAAPPAPQSTVYPSGSPSRNTSSHQFTYPTSFSTPLTYQIRQVGIQARAEISGCHLSVSESFVQLPTIKRMIISYRRWASLPSMILLVSTAYPWLTCVRTSGREAAFPLFTPRAPACLGLTSWEKGNGMPINLGSLCVLKLRLNDASFVWDWSSN